MRFLHVNLCQLTWSYLAEHRPCGISFWLLVTHRSSARQRPRTFARVALSFSVTRAHLHHTFSFWYQVVSIMYQSILHLMTMRLWGTVSYLFYVGLTRYINKHKHTCAKGIPLIVVDCGFTTCGYQLSEPSLNLHRAHSLVADKEYCGDTVKCSTALPLTSIRFWIHTPPGWWRGSFTGPRMFRYIIYQMQGVIFQIFSYFSKVLLLYRYLFLTLSHISEVVIHITDFQTPYDCY